ncbi:MAG TPA: sigma-70 family RNA polymerase sigma factor [Pyrinomonadaceae bacterium]|nr:sigma-70 family RNA polymerase sigma factor [Pyrinomonadaceae bacterium]
MSFGEPIALRGQAELEHPAAATAADSTESRPSAETQFIERLRAGEAAAFDRLVNERSADIYALLYRLTEDPEEARDLTQETFLQAFRSIAHFRGEADLRTWLYRIAVNQARNRWRWWRRRRRSVTISLDATDEAHELPLATRLVDEQADDPEARTLAHEREEILMAAVRNLARPYREAVVLRDVEGLSYEEVAVALDISVGTVKSRLSRGRTELRRKLEGSL